MTLLSKGVGFLATECFEGPTIYKIPVLVDIKLCQKHVEFDLQYFVRNRVIWTYTSS